MLLGETTWATGSQRGGLLGHKGAFKTWFNFSYDLFGLQFLLLDVCVFDCLCVQGYNKLRCVKIRC